MIFKAVRERPPYPDHGVTTQRDWAVIAPRQIRLADLTTTRATLDLRSLLDDDSTFYGDLFAHVVSFKGDLYLETGLHRALRAALQEVQPDALISLGVAVGRDVVSLEQVAINLDSAGIEDNDGDRRCDEPIVPDGREAYFSSLPVRASFERLRAAGEPVEISYTAGTYVCNHVFYEGQRISRELGLSIPAGFVHVPATRADGEETTEGVELTAHRDAGGVVRDEQGVPYLLESTVVRIIAEIASDTLPAVD